MPNSRLQNHIGMVEKYKSKEFVCVLTGNLLTTELETIEIRDNGIIEVTAYYGHEEIPYSGTLFDGKTWAKIIE
ncbi:MAG: hypothetical protein RIC57_09105 [Balneola sp.]